MKLDDRTYELAAVHEKYVNVKKQAKSVNKPAKTVYDNADSVSDDELIEAALNAKNGDMFAGLMDGNWKGRYPSSSEADLALCNLLAFYTSNDAARMNRLFRRSGLYREKWDEHRGEAGTYGEITIAKAIADCRETYTPSKKRDKKPVDEPPDIDTGLDALVQEADHGLPRIIVTNRDLGELSDEVLKSLEAFNNSPVIFIRGSALVRLDKINDKDKKERPIIKVYSEAALRGRMARVAQYQKVTKDTKKNGVEYSSTYPPIDIVKDLMSLPEESWRFPYLTGITQIPILRKDGSIFSTPGYDEESTLYYLPECKLDISLDVKTKEAVCLLEEIYCNFPFDCAASKANCLGLLLTLVLRELIDGPVPIAIIDKPQQGTGASLLANVNSLISTGNNAYMEAWPAGRDRENELRKRVTSLLIEGRSQVVIDNIESLFESAVLGLVSTCTSWEDRALGENRLITLPHRTVWVVTGNNVKPAGDLPRRCYSIRLDAKIPRPWTRSGFKHQNLLGWVKENRSKILSVVFKLAQNWIYAGRPIPEDLPVLGNFEEWTQTIGGILHYAGITGFLENLEEMYEKSEQDEGWEGFLSAWYELFGNREFTVKEILYKLQNNEDFARALPENFDINNKNFTRQFGQAIKKKEGMVFPSKLKIERDGVTHHAIIWKVTCMNIGELGSKGSCLPTTPRGRENIQENIQENIYTYREPAQNSPNSHNSPDNNDADNDFPWEQVKKKYGYAEHL